MQVNDLVYLISKRNEKMIIDFFHNLLKIGDK